MHEETLEPSGVEKILQVHSPLLSRPPFLAQKLLELERLAIEGKSEAVMDLLCEMVPTVQPFNTVGSHGRSDVRNPLVTL